MSDDHSGSGSMRKKRAIEMLAAGRMCSEVAAELGVHPQRISEWKRDPKFRAELDEMHREIREDALDTLRAAARRSAGAVARALDANPALAWQVFKALVLDKQHAPPQSGEGDEDGKAESEAEDRDLDELTNELRSIRRFRVG